MSRLAKSFMLFLLFAGLLGSASGVLAATYVSRATGNWNAVGTWAELRTGTITTSTASPTVTGVGTTFTTELAVGNVLYRADGAAIGTVQTITNNTTLTLTTNAASTNGGILYYRGATATPIAGDMVTVNSPNTVTVSAAAASTNLTINAGGILTQTASTLTLTGTLSVAGTHTVGNTVTVTGVTTVSGLLNITTTTGTKNFNGGVTINPGGTFRNNTVVEAVTIRGDFLNDGIFTSGTGTYTFNSAGQWGGGNPIAFGGAVTVSAARTVNTTVSVTGALSVTAGGLTNNNTLNTTGTFAISAANTITNNGTVTAAGAITGANAATSIWTNAANSTLNVAGALLATGTLNASANPNTVNYNGAAQTVKVPSGAPATYYHLTLSGSGTKTMPATAMTVTGNFTMSGAAGTSATATAALTVGGNFSIGASNTFANGANTLNVAGNFDQSGTFTAGAGVVTLNGGAAVQTISGAGTLGFANLTINNTGGITLARNVTVAIAIVGAHTLTSTCPTDWTLTSNGGATVEHSCPMVVNSINCSVSCAATNAATVSWTVTFSRSVTGVDATAFSLAASGLSGAYITTVTGGGTSWIVTANTGIGSGSLGLNQTGPGSVVPTLTGTFTGQVYTISATPALAEYRMDEASWNGTVNEVADSSGSGNNAQSFNSASTDATTPAIAGSPGTCRYGVFDNGGTITQGYVQTPLPDLTTDFTVTAWIRTTNNAATGQRILIDDQNNTGGYGISLGDGAAGIIRFYSRGVTPVILDSTYTIANNTWYFVAVVADIANRIRTIYVYNAAGTLLASTSDAAAFTGTWGTDVGPVSIGGEVNGPPQTELPASFHFRGNLDEVRVYQKVLNQNALAAIATQTHTCPISIPDHLEIQSSGSGLTCAASTLTIKACTDTAVPCITPYTGGVTGTLSATGTPTVNWDGTTGGAAGAGFVIPNGSSSVTKNVQVATAGTVVFGITSPSPVPTSATACNFGTPACTFTASLAGFIFSDTTTGNSYTIPTQVSGIATPTLYLRAVQASTTNSAVCTPAIISQTTAVNMGYACNNPATCQAGNLATINATPIAPAGTSVSLTFDANGSAPITARYDDVGQITLNANKTVTPFGGGTAITLNGSSNAFVVAPHHFGFSGITAGPIKAGNNFSATVTAYNGLATPTATPNFGKETSPESVTLTPNLVTPNPVTYPLASNPIPGNNVIAGTEFGAGGMVNDANGVATVNNLSWGDVGNITLTATNSNYLSSGSLAATGTSTSIGAFIPDHFDTVVTPGMLCPAGLTCPTLIVANDQGFYYSGQPFSEQVTAKNLAGGTTANYHSAYGLSNTVNLTAWDAKGSVITQNPGTGVLANITMASTAFSGGVGLTNTQAYTFATSPTNPTDIFLRAVDAVNTTVTSRLAIPANSVEGGVKVVSGRVKIGNAYGSELLPLSMTATVQYNRDGTASGWATSMTDSATSFTSTNIVPTIVKGPLASVSVVGSVTVAPLGVRIFTLNSPGITGSADISLNAPSYLLTGSNGAAVNPSVAGRATFGVYKGRNEFIYMRENY